MTYSKNPIRPASKTKMVGQVEFVYSTALSLNFIY